MWSLLINIFIIIGAIISITGACFLLIFAGLLIYDVLFDKWENMKIDYHKKKNDSERKKYIINHLDDLKKRYPELKIKYNIK